MFQLRSVIFNSILHKMLRGMITIGQEINMCINSGLAFAIHDDVISQ